MEQTATPSQNIPCLGDVLFGTPFSGLLIPKHLDNESRLALCRVNKAAREEVLISSESATCCMHIASEVDEIRRLSGVRAVKAALRTRGARPSNIKLDWTYGETLPLALVLDVLEGAGAGVHELTFSQHRVPAALVAAAGQSFPNLKALTIQDFDAVGMPHSSLFPHLTALAFNGNPVLLSEGTMHSMASYHTHLTHLALMHENWDGFSIAILFNRTISHTLRTLTLGTRLDDTLLGLLLAYTPALEVLSVDYIDLMSDAHAGAACLWHEITCICKFGVDVHSLACLPSPPDGTKLVLAAGGLSCQVITAEEELAAVQAATCMELQLKDGEPLLVNHLDVPVDEQPATLRASIDVLRAFTTQAAPQSMGLGLGNYCDGWTMSVPLMHELQRLPAWGKFNFGSVHWLPDASLYAALLSCLPASYDHIRLKEAPSKAHLQSICLGAVERGRQQPLHIIVANADVGVVESIQETLVQLGAADRVVVTRE